MRAISRVAVTHVLADVRQCGDAEPVATCAVRIARAHGAKLTLLHVLPWLSGEAGRCAGRVSPRRAPS